MKVIPAIDIRGGKVVRLRQGSINEETVYSDSPLETAEHWSSYGVEMIHIVDLDGAFEGRLKNLDIVRDIAKRVKAKIELGGGIRDESAIRKALDAGISKVVIGTRALDGDFLKKLDKEMKGSLVVGIDARRGIVHTKGWVFKTRMKAVDLAKNIEAEGIRTINYTDISKDGMMEGPSLNSIKEILKAVDIDVVASGGISSMEDVKNLKALEKDGLCGMIIGKALYENTIDLKEAIRVCEL
ncbi:MAG: 1-(5-phosphoribosyl)-5-[(5-phosphoribosylamino)methylideneamino]imidazole-4-carboxamide isomerase [Candidatus Omnitrophica bacterium]|nr:1-(5-phosphoribosyl)-5-[(5-phosphoribosylamino)methylideneamino]imidazole-4-carboxamide isomerase [Candidatus Omnitrophota bacterium]